MKVLHILDSLNRGGAEMAAPKWGIFMSKVYADKTLHYGRMKEFDQPAELRNDPIYADTRFSDILNNVTTIGELLPTYARTLKFRLTVRDNRSGGGGVTHNDDTLKVQVINTSTPFKVTVQNTAVIWNSGSSQTVTWDVSSSNISPINCANVKISFSTEGIYFYSNFQK